MLSVINSDVANMRSVLNTLKRLDIPAQVVSTADEIRNAERLILPGVGAFGAGMTGLRIRGLIEPIRDHAAKGTPILGICLGMQLLFESSAESIDQGEAEGLGVLPGRIVRFPSFADKTLKVPHVGWNQLLHDGESALLANVSNGGYAYFVHSYYAETAPAIAIACTDYGLAFPSVVGHKNVFGAQFHPEKSQGVGLRLLLNFNAMTI